MPPTSVPHALTRVAMPRRALARLGAVAALAAGLVLASMSSARAHVHVTTDNAAEGSYTQLVFRVPNESATAGTVKVSVTLPADKPLLSVRTKPIPGWDATIKRGALPKPVIVDGTTITEAPRTVTWTARPGTQVGPQQYEDFAISVGPLPAPGTLLLPATQTYSDGKVVAWDQPTPDSGSEPDYPAPSIEVTVADASGAHGAHAETGSAAMSPDSALEGADPVARWLAAGGLAMGVAGLGLALLGRRRGRP
ncbi:MAG: YcnI family copper-binding membrane protein [Intrasporangium sp.]|uniref:YcnI family copper-binding membrane protein n=1 Tax=Intrasporangium sp. TaxID=1925024 RepID=UPI003F7E8E2A